MHSWCAWGKHTARGSCNGLARTSCLAAPLKAAPLVYGNREIHARVRELPPVATRVGRGVAGRTPPERCALLGSLVCPRAASSRGRLATLKIGAAGRVRVDTRCIARRSQTAREALLALRPRMPRSQRGSTSSIRNAERTRAWTSPTSASPPKTTAQAFELAFDPGGRQRLRALLIISAGRSAAS